MKFRSHAQFLSDSYASRPGLLLSWLQINSSTCAMFAAVRAERFRPHLRLLDVPVESICLINRCRAYLYHCLKGNSFIIRCALYPFFALKIRIKILTSFVSGTMMFII